MPEGCKTCRRIGTPSMVHLSTVASHRTQRRTYCVGNSTIQTSGRAMLELCRVTPFRLTTFRRAHKENGEHGGGSAGTIPAEELGLLSALRFAWHGAPVLQINRAGNHIVLEQSEVRVPEVRNLTTTDDSPLQYWYQDPCIMGFVLQEDSSQRTPGWYGRQGLKTQTKLFARIAKRTGNEQPAGGVLRSLYRACMH